MTAFIQAQACTSLCLWSVRSDGNLRDTRRGHSCQPNVVRRNLKPNGFLNETLMMSAMTFVRSSMTTPHQPRLAVLLVGLSLAFPLPGLSQEAVSTTEPATPVEGEDNQGDTEGGVDEAGTEIDPRIQVLREQERRLRIERQTTITSSLPTESDLISTFAVPEGLAGQRGLRYGRFVLLPSLTVGAAYTDNVDAAENDRDEELSANATAVVRAQSVLARHAFGFDAAGTASHSFQEDDNDFFDWRIGGDGRFDLTRKSSVFGRLDYSLDTEDESSADAEGAVNDIESIDATTGYQFTGRKIGYLIDLGVNRENFSGDQSADRDNTGYSANQRVDFKPSEQLTLFFSPQYELTVFDEEVADDGEERDAQEATGLVGFDYKFRSPMALAAAIGYTRLFFDDPDRDDEDSVVASGTFAWQSGARTSFELSASHDLELTTVEDADARRSTALALRGQRQLGANMSLLGEVGTTYIDFQDIDRADIDLRAGVGVARRLADNFFLSLAYQYEQRFSDEDGEDFYENQALIGLSVIY